MALSFTHVWFYALYMGQLDYIGLLSYVRLPNIDTFHHGLSKQITFVKLTTYWIRKVFTYWKTVKLIFTWKLKFYQWLQMLVVFFETTGLLCPFARKYLPDTQVWKPLFVCQLFFQAKAVVPENSDECSSQRKYPHSASPLSNHNTSVCSVMCTFHLFMQNIKKMSTQGMEFSKINNFYCFIKNNLKRG